MQPKEKVVQLPTKESLYTACSETDNYILVGLSPDNGMWFSYKFDITATEAFQLIGGLERMKLLLLDFYEAQQR